MHLDGYNLYRSQNSLNQSDGLVYIDDTLPVTCSELYLSGVATSLFLKLQWAGTPCELLAGYRNPNSNLTRFTKEISRHFTDRANKNQHLILAGTLGSFGLWSKRLREALEERNGSRLRFLVRAADLPHLKMLKPYVTNLMFILSLWGRGWRGKLNPSPPAEVEDADHALDAMFELRPVTQHELFKVVDSLRARSAPVSSSVAALHKQKHEYCSVQQSNCPLIRAAPRSVPSVLTIHYIHYATPTV
ncbi:hypothetical protein J6590_061431 [Homalodisca vitripennis]|nr:hypothetical protein J6590_061431 [Homalodisca vitripennis]